MSAVLVKELRDRTGLGLLECKKALAAADGDVEKAIEEMRKSSGMKAAKKAGRTAADGVVVAKVADDGSMGVLVEVNSETDFVARDENFLAFVGRVVDTAFAAKETDVAALMAGELESAREALVQKNWREYQRASYRADRCPIRCCGSLCARQQPYRCAG
jgi:elongation factor Ts